MGTATQGTRRERPPVTLLSVSSVGSWALQPTVQPTHHPDASSFSILGRIVGTATIAGMRIRPAAGGQLSVSSVGSWALQRWRSSRPAPSQTPFSILGRIVGTATSDSTEYLGVLVIQLSVSSVGSWALQRLYAGGGAVTLTSSFQYPRSDRGHCNRISTARRTPRCLTLSVSSVGSWALQLRQMERRADDTLPFSILGRIVGTATQGRRNRSSPEEFFQYPRSDRGHCNLQCSCDALPSGGLSVSSVGSWALQPSGTPHHQSASGALSVSSVGSWALQLGRGGNLGAVAASFQYPRSDRGHCNRQPSRRTSPRPSTFSILGRIVGTATRIVNYTAIRAGTAFQYPRSDRGHCNSLLLHLLLPRLLPFSILGRIVGTATQPGAVSDTLLVSFQYPRSDRGHCNAEGVRLRLRAGRAFSILGRIVGTATQCAGWCTQRCWQLSVSSVGSWALQLKVL